MSKVAVRCAAALAVLDSVEDGADFPMLRHHVGHFYRGSRCLSVEQSGEQNLLFPIQVGRQRLDELIDRHRELSQFRLSRSVNARDLGRQRLHRRKGAAEVGVMLLDDVRDERRGRHGTRISQALALAFANSRLELLPDHGRVEPSRRTRLLDGDLAPAAEVDPMFEKNASTGGHVPFGTTEPLGSGHH